MGVMEMKGIQVLLQFYLQGTVVFAVCFEYKHCYDD